MPDPVATSIATALAAGAAAALTDSTKALVTRLVALVRERFQRRPSDQDTLEAAIRHPDNGDAVEGLASLLGQRMREDPEFAQQVRALWAEVTATSDGVTNIVGGQVHGSVVQARDVQGGITLHGEPRRPE